MVQDSSEGREKGLRFSDCRSSRGGSDQIEIDSTATPPLCPFSACDSMLLGACTTSNAAFREVGCKAANGSGEGRRDIRRVVLQPATVSEHQVNDFLEIRRCDCSGGCNRQMSGKSEILGLPCGLRRTTKTTCNRGACIQPHASALLVAGTRIIDGCSLRCASGGLPSWLV